MLLFIQSESSLALNIKVLSNSAVPSLFIQSSKGEKQNKTNLYFPLHLKQYNLQNRNPHKSSPDILLSQTLGLHLKKIPVILWARQAFRSNTSWLLKSQMPLWVEEDCHVPALKYQVWVNSTELLTSFGCIYLHSLLGNLDDSLTPIFCLHTRKVANVSHKQLEEEVCYFPKVSMAMLSSYLQAACDSLNAQGWKGMDANCSQSTFLGYSQKLSWEEPGNTF